MELIGLVEIGSHSCKCQDDQRPNRVLGQKQWVTFTFDDAILLQPGNHVWGE